MDEREVELIDYLRVMWWGKWIILGCLVVAVAVSAAVVWMRPGPAETYTATASYHLRQSLATYGLSALSTGEVSEVFMEAARLSDGIPVPQIASQEGRFVVTISTADDATRISTFFDDLLGLATRQLATRAGDGLQGRLLGYEVSLTQLARRQGLLADEIADLGSPPPDDPLLVALSGALAGVVVAAVNERASLEALSSLGPSDLFRLEEVSRSPVSLVPPVPVNRKTTLAVAGFLGLFLGVLLAFFVHYLVTVREREQAKRVDQKAH